MPAIPPQNAGSGAVTHIPPQSAPPDCGSQSSLGSSTQVCPLGQGMPAIPPQNDGSGRHAPFLATAVPVAAADRRAQMVTDVRARSAYAVAGFARALSTF